MPYVQKLKEPLYVTYALYKGRGNCSRSGMTFKNDIPAEAADCGSPVDRCSQKDSNEELPR